MQTIEERLAELCRYQSSKTRYEFGTFVGNRHELIEFERARRDALRASIAANWNAMVEALQFYADGKHYELCREQDPGSSRAADIITVDLLDYGDVADAALAKAKGKG